MGFGVAVVFLSGGWCVDIVSPTATAMYLVESAGGFASYSADVVATQSGRYAFSVRALPKHKDLSYRFLSPPLITWEP